MIDFHLASSMATFSGLSFVSSGIKSLPIGAGYPKLPFQNHSRFLYRFGKLNHDSVLDSPRKPNLQIQYSHQRCSGSSYKLSAGRNYQLSYNDDDSHTEPFLLHQMRKAIRNVRNLLQFLAEQPSQLKYIEWPSFQSTLKTATLTLVLVAFLIVALSSVDSTLSFLLALLLRRKA